MKYLFASLTPNSLKDPVPAPFFRKVFEVTNPKKKATLRLAVVGLYRLFLNGTEITKGLLAPGFANPNQVVYEDVLEITPFLKKQNVLVLWLGNGFVNSLDNNIWGFESASFRHAPYFALNIRQEGRLVLESDESFESYPSPILFDDLRCGEIYDARKEIPSISHMDFKKKGQKPFVMEPPKGLLEERLSSPVVAFEERHPTEIVRSKKGWIYDFGKNGAGYCRLHFKGDIGQRLDLTYGEMLQGGELDLANISFGERTIPGSVQHDAYFSNGQLEDYTPSFTYHGFRYVLVEGLKNEQATSDLLTAVDLRGAFEQRGHFASNDPKLNALEDCVLESDTSNFLHFPTDCPQREKNGWTGDASLSIEQFLYHFDCAISLKEWLAAIRASQKENGIIPGVVPCDLICAEGAYGPGWDSIIVEIPYQLYRFTGDSGIIRENLSMIERYFAWAETHRGTNGLFNYGFGDWNEAGGAMNHCSTPLEVTTSLKFIDMLDKASFLAASVGEQRLAASWQSLVAKTKTAFLRAYAPEGQILLSTQSGLAMALDFGVFPDSLIDVAYQRLQEAIQAKQGHFQAGIFGLRSLFHVLGEHDDAEEALRMILREDYPSFGYLLKHGATSLWEDFPELEETAELCRKDGLKLNSLNHHYHGAISGFFFENIAGIKVMDATHLRIQPSFVSSLNSATASYSSQGKSIQVEWQKIEGQIRLSIINRGFAGDIAIRGFQKQTPLPLGRITLSYELKATK